MTIKEWIRNKALSFLGMLNTEPGLEDKLTFVNDKDRIIKMKLREYNVWYIGDSDELLNFYTHANTLEYNYEPFYDRNKRSYFWNVSSTESDIKRTHSGQPRNIVDTMVNIVGTPLAEGGQIEEKKIRLDEILEDNNFWDMYIEEQMPMTLVEGWGAYKIGWNKKLSNCPTVSFYRAENVDFIYKSNRLIGIIFKDYYTDEKNNRYLITETRRVEDDNLHIEYELFKLTNGDETVQKVNFESVPQFAYLGEDNNNHLVIKNFNQFLAEPCLFFKDVSSLGYGRSIYAGKIDLFDDLDQCLSQSSNTVRKSTPVEYFNTDFLQRDKKSGLPLQPKTYDRKYTMYTGGKDANGNSNTNEPVQVTQPDLHFDEYSKEAQQILFQIISGIMSPATLGIDIAKKDNAEAQREKEKVTIFTRNTIIRKETKILSSLFSQLLCADELMRRGEITIKKYDISIKYGEFADSSFESKLTSLLPAIQAGAMSYKMFVDKLYGDSLKEQEKEKEIKFLTEQNEHRENPYRNEDEDKDDEMIEELVHGYEEKK